MLFSRCLVKTHAEGVVESMGNYVELHSDKRRGQMEALIHWNGPPLARADWQSIWPKQMELYYHGQQGWQPSHKEAQGGGALPALFLWKAGKPWKKFLKFIYLFNKWLLWKVFIFLIHNLY